MHFNPKILLLFLLFSGNVALAQIPLTLPDAETTAEESPVPIDILANDIDLTGLDPATIDLDPAQGGQQLTYTDPGKGAYTVNGAGIVQFVPVTDFFGQSSAQYTVTNGLSVTSAATNITVTVTNINDAPTAVNDILNMTEDINGSIDVTSNDTDPDGSTNIDKASVDLDPSTPARNTTFTTLQGDFSVDNSGVVTFDPNPNYNGPASVTYTVEDLNNVLSGVATLSVNVASVNDPPTAGDDAATAAEDTPSVVINILANDSDVDGTINTSSVDLNTALAGIQTTNDITGGLFSYNGSQVTFTPDPDFFGPASITYSVADNDGAQATATITATITAVNDAPLAVDDATSTGEGSQVSLNVLSNDTDPESNINAASVDLNPATPSIDNTRSTTDGEWSVSNTGLVTFTPDDDFNGNAIITYTVNDLAGAKSNEATITIAVNGSNDPPVAVNDVATVAEDNNATINVLANDTDGDGAADINPATVDLDVSTPARETTFTTGEGVFTVSNAGVVTFDPNQNYQGNAIHQYNVKDNSGATSNNATITVTVTDVNDPPVAVADVATTPEDTPTTLNVVSNDTDVDGTINVATVDLDPSAVGTQTSVSVTGGTFSVATTGIVSFTPTTNYFGPATTNYTVNDNSGTTSNATSITVTVTSVNDPPVAQNDAVSTPEDTQVSLNVLSNDSDIDGTLSASTLDIDTSLAGIQTTHTITAGTFTITAAGVVTFTPTTDFNGPAAITYTVNDNGGAVSNTATITITVNAGNDPPVAVNDATSTNEDTSVSLNVVSNDTDPDGTINAGSVDLNPTTPAIDNSFTITAGSFTVNGAGLVTFVPATDFTGTATLNYTVRDNNGAVSNQAVISITVNSQNDPPVAVNDATSTNESTSVNINVVTNDSDPDGTIVASTVDLDLTTSGVQNTITTTAGTFTVSPVGLVTFVPSAIFNGVATIQYTVQDNNGATSNTATISITVNAVNDPPVAVDDATSTNEDVAVTLNVVTNDTDEDGTVNAATVDLNTSLTGIQNTHSTTAGSFTVSPAGVVTYTPAANFTGPATLSYRVNDNNGATSNSATITITVNPINDPPTVANDAVTTNEDVPVNINVLSNDSDVDGTINAATVDLNPSLGGIQTSISISGGTVSVSTTGVVTFTPTVNFYGIATCSYAVNDNTGATSTAATITFTVNAVNDPPIAANDITGADENETVTLNVVSNDLDIDGTVNVGTVDLNTSAAGIQTTRNVTGGNFTVASTGIVTFTPTINFNGIATVNYTVQDDAGATSNAATITVTVASINSDPVAANDVMTTNEDVAVSLNVTTNDNDPDGSINAASVDLDPSTAGVQSNRTTTEGTYTVTPAGLVTFTPTGNFHGTSTITYTVNDNVGATSNTATITVTVNSVNDLPVAANDAAATTETTAITITILSNDTDVDGTIDPTTVDLNTTLAGIQNSNTTTGGAFTVSTAGVVTFTPNGTFSGVTTLGYRVNDNAGGTSNTATISVTVSSINDAPVAANDAATTNEDVVVTVNVISNDSDEDGTIVASSVDLNPSVAGPNTSLTTSQGTFTVNASGVVTFVPATNFNGTATATYTVLDNGGLPSNEATITITVNPVNDAPTAVNDVLSTTEDMPATLNIISNDSDIDGTIDLTTIDLNTALNGIQNTHTVAGGSFTANTTTGVVTFTPTTNFSGTFNLSYRVSDDDGLVSNLAQIAVTVTAVNDPPVFTKIDTVKVFKNSGLKTITVTGISPGPSESEPMLLTATSGNTGLIPNVTVSHSPNTASTATLSFTPAANKSGLAEITVKLVDTGLNEYTQVFIVEVIEVKITSTPILVATVGVTYTYAIKVQVTPEIEKNNIAYEVSAHTKPTWLNLTGPAKDKTLSGEPTTSASPTNTIRLQVKAGALLLDEQIYTLSINKVPEIESISVTATEDVQKTFTSQEFANAYEDGNNDPLTKIVITRLPERGELKFNGNPIAVDQEITLASIPALTYISLLDSSGADSFGWKASDGFAYSLAANVNINVQPVNDGPRITNIEAITDSLKYEVGSNVPVLLTGSFEAHDPDDKFLTGAQIGFRSINYIPAVDQLIFTNTSKITGDFDDQSGILVLTGTATVQEYEDAIKTVLYNFSSNTLEGEPRKGVFIVLTDGKTQGESRDRGIKLESNYKDPDIPNAFSPDGNGKNDVWIIAADNADDFTKAELKVYNRRGMLVYETIGFDSSWDGTLNGTILPADTYFYTIEVNAFNKFYKGSVTIIR